jgi:hypothetical protein
MRFSASAALSGAVPTWEGQGVFVVVRLPKPVPGMAMRLPNHIVGASPLLDRPELRGAFESGEIPPWTVRADEFFIFEPHDSWTTVAVITQAVERAVDRALSLVRLLDLAPGDGESAVAVDHGLSARRDPNQKTRACVRKWCVACRSSPPGPGPVRPSPRS